MTAVKTITLGELKFRLGNLLSLPDDTEVFFGVGDLSFYRPKNREYIEGTNTPNLVQIEFNELYKISLDTDDSA